MAFGRRGQGASGRETTDAATYDGDSEGHLGVVTAVVAVMAPREVLVIRLVVLVVVVVVVVLVVVMELVV